MAYFIVQVQTNFEKYVLSNLAEILLQKNVNIVKSIYALDQKIDFNHTKISDNDLREYLKQVRIRNYLNNIRYAYSQLKSSDFENINLKEAYKKQIKSLTNEVNKYPSKRNKIGDSFIRGYIIIELFGDYQQIPSDLYHDIKSIPKVISIPNKYNVPETEIKCYFNRLKERKKQAN